MGPSAARAGGFPPRETLAMARLSSRGLRPFANYFLRL